MKGNEFYCKKCNLNQIFTESDLIDLVYRFFKLKDALNDVNSNLKLEIINGFKLSNNIKIDHFNLLESLDKNDYEIYTNAYNKGNNCLQRFLALESIKNNFSIDENNLQIKTSVSKPSGKLGTFVNIISQIMKIESIERLQSQIESLCFHLKMRNKISFNISLSELIVLDNAHWDEIEKENTIKFLDYLTDHNVYIRQIWKILIMLNYLR